MANNYYDFLTPFVAATKVRSNEMNDELSGIEGGFDKLPSDPTSIGRGTVFFGEDSGAANTFVITRDDPQSTYSDGDHVGFFAAVDNTGASTIDIDGIGVAALVNSNGEPMVGAQLFAGAYYEAVYDAANTRWSLFTHVSDIPATDLRVEWAEEWANKAEDSLVSTEAGGDGVDDYSALHWAAKSADSALTIPAPDTALNYIRVNAAGNGYELIDLLATANTFTASQSIVVSGAADIILDSATGSSASYRAYNNGLLRGRFGYATGPDAIEVRSVDALGAATTRMTFDASSSGNIDVTLGQLQQAGVDVATVGANTFTGDQTIEKAGPIINMKSTAGSGPQIQLRHDSDVSFIIYDRFSVEDTQFWKFNAAGDTIVSEFVFSQDGTINVNSGQLQQAGVDVATVEANTFTASQSIVVSGAADIILDSAIGTSASYRAYNNGLLRGRFGYATGPDAIEVRSVDALGAATTRMTFDASSSGSIDVTLGQLQQAGVDVATVGANTFTESQTIDVSGAADIIVDSAAGTNSMLRVYCDGIQRGRFGYAAGVDGVEIRSFDAVGALTSRLSFDDAAAGLINVSTGQLQQGGVNVATVATTDKMKGFSASLTSAQAMTVSSGVLDSGNCTNLAEEWDVGSWFDLATGKFLPDEEGYYDASFRLEGTALGASCAMAIFKNGVAVATDKPSDSSGTEVYLKASRTVYLNGTTDYLEFVFDTSGDTSWTLQAATFIQARLAAGPA